MMVRIDPHTLERAKERGATPWQIQYDSRTDLLYLRLDDGPQHVVNRRVSEDVVLDMGRGDRLVGIEIMDASRHVRMDKLLPVTYEAAPAQKVPAMVHEGGARYAPPKKRRRRK
jgi:uncharacterized protein YuzE